MGKEGREISHKQKDQNSILKNNNNNQEGQRVVI